MPSRTNLCVSMYSPTSLPGLGAGVKPPLEDRALIPRRPEKSKHSWPPDYPPVSKVQFSSCCRLLGRPTSWAEEEE